jgi:hypothetical protein
MTSRGDGGIPRRERPRSNTNVRATGLAAFREAAKALLRRITAASIMRRARVFYRRVLPFANY